MKKLLLVTVLSAFTILSAASAFAQEVPATKFSEKLVQTNGEGNTTLSLDIPANISFPDKEKLKEMHYQMIDNMIKDITGNSEMNKRVKREVLSDTGEQWYTARIGQEFTNDAQFDLVPGLHVIHLQTDYKIYSRQAKITSTSTAGTRAVWPVELSKKSSILSNNSRTVSSRANFTYDINPIKVGNIASRDYTITTTIRVKYAEKGVIHFTAQSVIK